MAARVGHIGLGSMGKIMARNELAAGFPLTVFDLRSEPMRELEQLGASIASSSQEVARRSEIVCISVVDDVQVKEVMLGSEGVLAGAAPGLVVAIHSNVQPKTARKIGALAEERKVGVIDATVSGAQFGAEARTLCFMVGGDPTLLERCRPVFEASGPHIFHMGPLGTGGAMKLAQQVIFCLNRLAAYEGMVLAEKAGVDLKAAQEALHWTLGQSHVTDHWLERYRDTEPDKRRIFATILHSVSHALELAYDLGVPLPASALMQQLFPVEHPKDLKDSPRRRYNLTVKGE
jgi:3-hydroxyisobutyrate dehydrogenase-like beta-hydroxyacid dehydrogenase